MSDGTRVEFVGGPRDGEHRIVDQLARTIRFTIGRGRGKPKLDVIYRKRSGRRGPHGTVYYDFVPKVAA